MISSWAWNLLMLYLILSLCAVFFDLWVMLGAKAQERATQRRTDELKSMLEHQLSLVREGKPPDAAIQKRFFRRMRSVEAAMCFSALVGEYVGEKAFSEFLAQSGKKFSRLCRHYRHTQPMHRATFAWALVSCDQAVPQTKDFLLSCVVEKGSIYCRENALTALYRSGNPDTVLSALKHMSTAGIQHSQKLLTDGFLSFQGDRAKLCAMMWKAFPQFSAGIRLAVVDFMRLLGADYRADLFPLLEDPETDDELCFAILRYYGRCTWPAACQSMIEFLSMPRRGGWEYAAVSATTLRNYQSDAVVDALLCALSNPGWYVRYNAAESLVSMPLSGNIFEQILSGKDRYAREMIQYMMERRRQKDSGSAAAAARKGEVCLGVS